MHTKTPTKKRESAAKATTTTIDKKRKSAVSQGKPREVTKRGPKRKRISVTNKPPRSIVEEPIDSKGETTASSRKAIESNCWEYKTSAIALEVATPISFAF